MELRDEWPKLLDLSLFPNEMISGLTLPEINNFLNETSDNSTTSPMPTCSYEFESNNRIQKSSASSPRFAQALSDEDLQSMRDSCIPDGPKKRKKRAIGLYEKWRIKREIYEHETNLPTKNEILSATNQQLDYWLPKFICEVRKMNGEMYPRDTLIAITAGINAHFTMNG